VGVSAQVTGDLESVGDVFLRNYAVINGDVTTGGHVNRQYGAMVTGVINEHTPLPVYAVPTRSVSPGTKDVFLYRGQSMTLAPGAYDEIHAYAGSTLTLTAGVYEARRFIIESSSVTLRMNISSGPINVNVQGELRFGDRMVMSLVGGSDPNEARFYSSSTSQVTIGTDLTFYGVVMVPDGELYVFSRTRINGNMWAKRITVDTDSRVTGSGCPECMTGACCDDWHFRSEGYECRISEGICDVTEVCSGASGECPVDGFVPAGTECRASVNEWCDMPEHCDGFSPDCPPDDFDPSIVPDLDLICDGEDEDCDGQTDEDISPYCDGTAVVTCESGSFVFTDCDNADVCDGLESCSEAVCIPGTPPVVDDGNPCTEDSCDPLAGVIHTPLPEGTSCSDGNPDNGEELCDASGNCVVEMDTDTSADNTVDFDTDFERGDVPNEPTESGDPYEDDPNCVPGQDLVPWNGEDGSFGDVVYLDCTDDGTVCDEWDGGFLVEDATGDDLCEIKYCTEDGVEVGSEIEATTAGCDAVAGLVPDDEPCPMVTLEAGQDPVESACHGMEEIPALDNPQPDQDCLDAGGTVEYCTLVVEDCTRTTLCSYDDKVPVVGYDPDDPNIDKYDEGTMDDTFIPFGDGDPLPTASYIHPSPCYIQDWTTYASGSPIDRDSPFPSFQSGFDRANDGDFAPRMDEEDLPDLGDSGTWSYAKGAEKWGAYYDIGFDAMVGYLRGYWTEGAEVGAGYQAYARAGIKVFGKEADAASFTIYNKIGMCDWETGFDLEVFGVNQDLSDFFDVNGNNFQTNEMKASADDALVATCKEELEDLSAAPSP
jgi:hypothetical protein